MRLRSHLVVLVLVALVPVLGFAALVIRDNARLQLAATERGMRRTAHAVAQTVDKTLETAITSVQALGASEHIDAGDLEAFHALCRRVVQAEGWSSIVLFDADGRGLMHTAIAPGSPVPPATSAGLIAQVRDARRPAASDLHDGPVHRALVAVYVPVVRAGAVRFVISAAVSAATFGEVLRAQELGPGGVAVLQDRQHVIIARTQREAEMVGRRVANPTAGREGWIRSRLQEGTEVYVAFATAPLSGWRVVLTAPVASIEGPLRRGVWQMLAGAALAAALAGACAFLLGRRISGAVRALVGIARAVERGNRAEPLRTGVAEIDAVAGQLSAAADLARAREQEAAVRERQSRAIAEVAHALNASPDLDTVLRTAMAAVRGLVHADGARVALVDEAGRLALRYATSEAAATPPGFVFERGQGIGGLAWATGKPVRTDDIRADPRFWADPDRPADALVSCLAVPIVTADVVVGVIFADNLARRPFTASDEAALVTLADHAAVAVQKARLLAGEHAARAEAEAASRGKDELLAMLGHELRNPLSAIGSAVQILGAAEAPAEAVRRAREIITRQNAHLAHLVDDLLDVARVTSGKIALDRRPIDLARAVRQSMTTLAAGGRTEAHRVAVDVQPVWADADETRFEQVVTNLVGNALKFTPAGGTIDVTLREEGGQAVLRVRDSGVGIAPRTLPRVFDLFVQAERGPDRGPGGLGLGLALVRRIAELHGGGVEAASDGPGRGSVFTVRVPALAAPLPPAPEPAPRPVTGISHRVLIVEDNADAREMLRRALELAGHEVHEAPDGPAGVAAALAARPDVALVDIGLPGFDGYELARQVRAKAGTSIHLVALTGYGQPDDQRQAHEAGFDAHLVKPVEPATLLAAIDRAPVSR